MREILSILTLVILLSCSGNALVPNNETKPQSANKIPQYQVWVSGNFAWNSADEKMEFVPSRSADAHFNVWGFLNPPNCADCVKLTILNHDPGLKTIDVEVKLKNPTLLTGYFVRGIVDAPSGSGVTLNNPDAYWHLSSFGNDKPGAPFKAYGDAGQSYAFGPGETKSRVYEFSYGQLTEFSKCGYYVIVRYPQFPGEVVSILEPVIFGTLTTLGGFVSVRNTVEKTLNCPNFLVNMVCQFPQGEKFEQTMRWEDGNTYLTWIEGISGSAGVAELWVSAEIEGANGNYLVQRFEVPVKDVKPTPYRKFPSVATGVGVFVDQLSTQMTEAQKQFMAMNCAGSQKLVKSLADSMRGYNPYFIVLQYHLAFGAGDISNIYGNDWVKNWTFESAQEDFYEHREWSSQINKRVLQLDWNWYLTDPSGIWTDYFIGNTIERMRPIGDQFDGVFADSASQPWNTNPSKWWEGSDDPHDMFVYWTPKTQDFFNRVAKAYHTQPIYYYFIPNAGSWVTTISDISYDQCDGVMIEGFARWSPSNYFTETDWKLQMNRARHLASNDKIILAQTSVDIGNTIDRAFVVGSYMLIKDNFTFLNMLGDSGFLAPEWYPEYYLDYGEAMEDWTNVDELKDSGGCYARNFTDGIVIVNPSDETRYYTTTKTYSHTMWAGGGYLPEDGVPTGVVTGPIEGPGEKELPPHSAWFGMGN